MFFTYISPPPRDLCVILPLFQSMASFHLGMHSDPLAINTRMDIAVLTRLERHRHVLTAIYSHPFTSYSSITSNHHCSSCPHFRYSRCWHRKHDCFFSSLVSHYITSMRGKGYFDEPERDLHYSRFTRSVLTWPNFKFLQHFYGHHVLIKNDINKIQRAPFKMQVHCYLQKWDFIEMMWSRLRVVNTVGISCHIFKRHERGRNVINKGVKTKSIRFGGSLSRAIP